MTKPYIYDSLAEAYILMQEELLIESRINWLKTNTKEISTEHDPQADYQGKDDIIDHLAEHGDPTKKKVYTAWLTKRYHAGDFKQEDAYKVADHLKTFDAHKAKLASADINKYNSLDELKSAVAPYQNVAGTKKELQKQLQGNASEPGHELKYEDDNIQIYHLSDKNVAKKLYARKSDPHPGKLAPTEWCTSTELDKYNKWDDYMERDHPGSKLHVVHRKSDRAVFQYHPESNQFMDADDNAISAADFKSIAPSLHKAWKENPDLI